MSNKINNPNENGDNVQVDDTQEPKLVTDSPGNIVTGNLNSDLLPPSPKSTDDTDKPQDIQSQSEPIESPNQSDSAETEKDNKTATDSSLEDNPAVESVEGSKANMAETTAPDALTESHTLATQPESAEETDVDQTDLAQPEDPNQTVSDKSEDIEFDSDQTRSDNKPKTYAQRSRLNNDVLKASFLSFNNKKDDVSPEKNPDTAILSSKSPTWKKIIDGQVQGGTSTLGEQREVLFVIRGMIERVVMKDNSTVTLGRFDTGTVPNEEIDLIPYGAIDRGVSRRHCKIQLQENQLYVVDLESTNGTFLAGVRLKAQSPEVLRKGDELLLGRLAVQVLFR